MIGSWILSHWVGPTYAEHSLHLLQILIAANIVRTVCAPYATMVVATSRQSVATASPVAEGIVNLASSIWLVQHLGAIGVALGTLLGSVVGVAVHFGVSMRFTQSTLALSRMDLFMKGMIRPAAMAIPSILLACHGVLTGTPPLGSTSDRPLAFTIGCVWALSTLSLAWLVSMTGEDRESFVRIARGRLMMRGKLSFS